jgi:hypothetical protein
LEHEQGSSAISVVCDWRLLAAYSEQAITVQGVRWSGESKMTCAPGGSKPHHRWRGRDMVGGDRAFSTRSIRCTSEKDSPTVMVMADAEAATARP